MHRSWFVSAFLLVALTIPTLTRADEWAKIVRHYAFPGGKMDVSNETFGFDPLRGERKRLHVVFDTPNGGYERDFDEGDTVRFGGRR